MKLTWMPYELQLQHTFTVASYSRTTTPDVQVRIDYDGYTGYGEASMPPYLGQTVESVCAFLEKVRLEQFSDPFQLEEILYRDIDEPFRVLKTACIIADFSNFLLYNRFGKVVVRHVVDLFTPPICLSVKTGK